MLRLDAEYVLPLRWSADQSRRELPELLGYLAALVGTVDVTVVDGSEAKVFGRHAAALPFGVRHVAPDPRPGANGKVRGVVTGVRRARHEAAHSPRALRQGTRVPLDDVPLDSPASRTTRAPVALHYAG